MSRLYEALQRADLERKIMPVSEEDTVVDSEVLPAVEEPPPARAKSAIDDIAHFPWNPAAASFPTLADRGLGVEQFRSLRSRIYQARYESPIKTLLISSGMPSEGKSFIAANLAMNLARNTVNNILLIDGDLRRPTLHKLLGAPSGPGLSEFLQGRAELKDILQKDSAPKAVEGSAIGSIANLTFIPAGKCGDNSSELVANHRVDKLIEAVAPYFDWILIDSPPVLAVTDAVELAHAADAVLLIARGGRTPYDIAQRTQTTFSKSRILGFVLNDVKDAPRSGSYYYYYGGQEASIRAK
ncbi:MAG: CpsD/CapB family tyrosine-protein kinase [Terracidiphilus sp.]|jgi:capsular exopolysaccharide synthesis family protein